MDGGHRGKLGGADQGPEQVTRAKEFRHYCGDTRIPRVGVRTHQAQDRATFWDRYMRGGGGGGSNEQVGRVPAGYHSPPIPQCPGLKQQR